MLDLAGITENPDKGMFMSPDTKEEEYKYLGTLITHDLACKKKIVENIWKGPTGKTLNIGGGKLKEYLIKSLIISRTNIQLVPMILAEAEHACEILEQVKVLEREARNTSRVYWHDGNDSTEAKNSMACISALS